jgi:predicted peptidase
MLTKIRFTHVAASLLIGLCLAQAEPWGQAEEPSPGKQVEQELVTRDSGKVPYLLYLPKEYEPSKPLPFMLFLHGRGESDGPLQVVAKWGPPLLVSKGESLPFIIASPQCPKDDNWSSPTQQTRLVELLDSVISRYNIDKSKVWLTGLSMGGSGSWRLSADHPERFSAVVPICGRADIKDAERFRNVPMWVFVGDKDGVYKNNVSMAEAIRDSGSQSFLFTTLENVGHNSWSAAYATPDLYAWLQQQKLHR